MLTCASVGQALEQLPEEFLCGLFVPATLHQNVEHGTILLDSTPQGVPFFVDGDAYLIHMPLVVWAGPAAEVIRVLLPEVPAPCAEDFIGHGDATDQQQFCHITVAERKAEIQSEAVADDLPREPVMFVEMGWGGHSRPPGMRCV